MNHHQGGSTPLDSLYFAHWPYLLKIFSDFPFHPILHFFNVIYTHKRKIQDSCLYRKKLDVGVFGYCPINSVLTMVQLDFLSILCNVYLIRENKFLIPSLQLQKTCPGMEDNAVLSSLERTARDVLTG